MMSNVEKTIRDFINHNDYSEEELDSIIILQIMYMCEEKFGFQYDLNRLIGFDLTSVEALIRITEKMICETIN